MDFSRGRFSHHGVPCGLGLTALMLALLAGCGFNPKPKDGKLACDEGCPSGYVCRADNRCYRKDSPVVDAAIDSPSDGPDLASSDGGNGETAERYPTADAHPETQVDVPVPGIATDAAEDAGFGGAAGGGGGNGGAGGTGETGGALGTGGTGETGGNGGTPGTGGNGGTTGSAPDAGRFDGPADAPADTLAPACGAVGEPCCAGVCNGGNCCVSGLCLANGATCSTGGTCSNGTCSLTASLLASTEGLGLGSAITSQPSPAASFTITNTGQQTSGVLTLASSNAEFAIQTGIDGDCVSGVTTLAASASCAVHIILTPNGTGARSASITFSATPGGSGSVKASGAGIAPGSLSSSVPSLSFGTVTLGSSMSLSFTLSNVGQQTSGVISLASSSAEFKLQTDAAGDCIPGASTLGASESCTVRVVYTPSDVASRAEVITFSAAPGGSGSVSLTGGCAYPTCKLQIGTETTRLGKCTLGK